MFIAAFAQTDMFTDIEKLQIDTQVAAEILAGGQRIENSSEEYANSEIYQFSSERYAHPHVLVVTDGKLTFMQLTIPQAAAEKYRQLQSSLGEPEIKLEKVESEIMLGYPQQGLNLVVNGSGTVLRLQKIKPKTVAELVVSEGRNFQPVKNSIDTLIETHLMSPTPIPSTDIFQFIQLNKIQSLIFITIISVVLLSLIWWKFIRKR
ncbi:MAG: hypothetical protein AAB874_07745 [Patescibacteria group bacterium]